MMNKETYSNKNVFRHQASIVIADTVKSEFEKSCVWCNAIDPRALNMQIMFFREKKL